MFLFKINFIYIDILILILTSSLMVIQSKIMEDTFENTN